MLNKTKSIWQSKTFWGGAVAIGSGIAGLFDIYIAPSDVMELSQLLSSGASTVGGMAAIYGRIRATRRIGR